MGKELTIPGQASETALVLPEDISFEEWLATGEKLKRAGRALMWWVGDWILFGERKYGETYSQALEATDYEYQTLADAAWVAKKIEFSRRRETLSWSHHKEVARLSKPEQSQWLGQAAEHGWSRDELRRRMRDSRRQQKFAGVRETAELAGTYNVVYADPPWRYEHAISDSREIEEHYATMALEEICGLPVAEIAAEQCVLYLWAPPPITEQAFQVIRAWGFEYKTHLVWDKQKIGMGYYARQRHELLLVATKGDIPPPDESARVASVVEYPREEHSKKPDIFYEIIERAYPLRRVELFARQTREGWDSWGNEL